MPYINPDDRDELWYRKRLPETPGELNFLLTKTCKSYIQRKGACYQTFNDLVGALECAKLEYYRRQVALYEDVKAKENGEI